MTKIKAYIHRKKYLLSSLRRIQIGFLQGGSSEESSVHWNLWDPGRVLCLFICFCFAFFWTRGRKTVGVFYFGSYLYCWVLFIISIFLPLFSVPFLNCFLVFWLLGFIITSDEILKAFFPLGVCGTQGDCYLLLDSSYLFIQKK